MMTLMDSSVWIQDPPVETRPERPAKTPLARRDERLTARLR